jgi:hypothetical protein
MGAKLNWEKVNEIRRQWNSTPEADRSLKALAQAYDVAPVTIDNLVRGISWRRWSPDADPRYLDMATVAANHSQVYTDFEGFTTKSQVMKLYRKAMRGIDYDLEPEIKTLLIHWIYEAADQAEAPTTDEILTAWTAISMVVNCRYFLKEDAK